MSLLHRQLKFQIKDDSAVPSISTPVSKPAPKHAKPLSTKRLQAQQKREELCRLKSKQARVRDFLVGPVFLNWHFLTPDFQLLVLQWMINFYESKTAITRDVEFMVQMSVSPHVVIITRGDDVRTRKKSLLSLFWKQSLLHCGLGVLVDDGFNCFIFYMGSLEKCCFLFRDVFEHWFTTDSDNLKKFAAHARSACSLAVASTENGFFTKWVKSLTTTYVPEKEKGFAQVI